MKWIGLTGGIGTGKSTASEILRALGVPVIDADQLARQALEKGQAPYEQVVIWMGSSILQANAEIDRAKLGEQVFKDSGVRLRLEQLIHPWVQSEVKKQRQVFELQNQSLAVYDVPLLFEKNLEGQFDQTLLIACSEVLQKRRLKERNNWSDQHIQERIMAQLPLAEKRKRASQVIENEGTKEDLKAALQVWLQRIFISAKNP